MNHQEQTNDDQNVGERKVRRQFRPWLIRTLANSYIGLFGPWVIRTLAYSDLGLFGPWLIRTLDYSDLG